MNLFEYCAAIFFGFYLLNYSDILAMFRTALFAAIHADVAYALKCSFCFTFWFSMVTLYWHPWYWVLVAPVVNLFAIKLFTFLSMEVHTAP